MAHITKTQMAKLIKGLEPNENTTFSKQKYKPDKKKNEK